MRSSNDIRLTFSSRIVAGLSIAVLGSETWKNSYAHTIDRVG
jgi:hypothetical protein